MTKRLTLEVAEFLSLTTPSGKHIDTMVVSTDNATGLIELYSVNPMGVIILQWDGEDYRDFKRRVIQVERPVFVKAVLKRVVTEDGILSLEGSAARVGDVYKMQINSMAEENWGHSDHPGRRWKRMTAMFINPSGVGGRMPIELFDIETN